MQQPNVRGYTDYARWEADWRGFVVNERPVVQRTVEPSPLLTLKPDHGLIQLFRAHYQMPDPTEGGDVVVEHRVATHGPSLTAKALIQYRWSNPMAYTMTLVYQLPDALPWLRLMLPNGGCWCGCAPRPDLGMLWLPAPDGLAQHLALIAAFFSLPSGAQCGRQN